VKGRDHLEDVGVDGRMILEWICNEITWERVAWINLAWKRNQ